MEERKAKQKYKKQSEACTHHKSGQQPSSKVILLRLRLWTCDRVTCVVERHLFYTALVILH